MIFNTEYKSYPVVTCDFTKSDNWFTFYGKTSNDITYGRDNNHWFYITRSSALAGASWTIPSSIYSKWNLKKAELFCYSTATDNGWWLVYGVDTYYVRSFNSVMDKNFQSTGYSQQSATLPAWWYKLIIDLENNQASIGSTILTLWSWDSSTLQTYWTGWNLRLWIFMKSANTTSYIEKATFYF